MKTNLSRRFPATLAGLLLLAGCASLAPRGAVPVAAPSAAGYPMAADSLVRDEDEDGGEGEGERGTPVSIEYNLRMEADEQGPPRVWQLIAAARQ